MLPRVARCRPARAAVARARAALAGDRDAGRGRRVAAATRSTRKYPRAGRDWAWFWVFPVAPCICDRSAHAARDARHHLHEKRLQRDLQAAVAARRHRQAGDAAHAAPFVRHAPAAGRLRHPHRAGAARPRRRQHDHDLHARAEVGRRRHVRSPLDALIADGRCAARDGAADTTTTRRRRPLPPRAARSRRRSVPRARFPPCYRATPSCTAAATSAS